MDLVKASLVKKVDKRQAKAIATKTHRDRLNDFNEQLAKLSEHNDVPRVSGGC
ncbi:hypothetical protein T484DRAFT_1823048 [Baffinella frigidus]|nr:hypothetical protein T484DRAFT_1823048 [Cryptophyta sp. CCMP2293]